MGLSLFTLQVTHKIEADIDVERDFIVDSVTSTSAEVEVETIENFSTGYHTRNGGGDLIQTDGNLPIIDVRPVATVGERLRHTDSRDRRPAQTVFGAGIAGLRALIYVATALALLLSSSYRDQFTADTSTSGVGDSTGAIVGAVIFLLVGAVVDAMLAWAVLRGRNWARIWLMSVSVFSTVLAFPRARHGLSGADPETARAGRRQHPGAARPLQPRGPGVRRAKQGRADASTSHRTRRHDLSHEPQCGTVVAARPTRR